MNKKFIALMTSALMLAVPIVSLAATVSDNPAGTVLDVLASGDEMETNNGTITTNNGTVDENKGTIADNKNIVGFNAPDGTVTANNGTVAMNDGEITANNGTLDINYSVVVNNNGNVSSNEAGATVNTNSGTVDINDGIVADNRGTVISNSSKVTANNGTVQTNRGTVTTNNDTVTDNYGTIDYNYGTVTGGTVINNYGTVTGGTVTNNYGTVTGGTVTNQYYRVTVPENVNIVGAYYYGGSYWIKNGDGVTFVPVSNDYYFTSDITVDTSVCSVTYNQEQDTFTFDNITGDITVYVTVGRFGAYKVISGNGQTWTGGDLTFSFEADHAPFMVYIERKGENRSFPVSSDNYSAKVQGGVLYITLKESYIKTFPKGEYILMLSLNSGTAESFFTLGEEQKKTSPRTGDMGSVRLIAQLCSRLSL